jgi:hypothetical protein
LSGFDPEWEKMKAACRNLRPHDAVMECAWLSDQYRRMHRSMSPVQPDFRQIISSVRAKRVPFVLTGEYGICTWTGRPQATQDIDIFVKGGRNQARAVNALKSLYPGMEVRERSGVVSFFVPREKEPVIDVIAPHRPDIEVTLQTGLWVDYEGLRFRIPELEPALANKYGAMLAPDRDPLTRLQDAVHFSYMARHSADEGREPIDLARLSALGELAWPGRGGAEILRLVEQARTGQVPTLDPEPRRPE